MNEQEVQAYMKRIGYSGTMEPTFDVLCALQKQHLLHIPFENLDIHYHNPIVLDSDRFFRKLVLRMRGGFCYELNGLFFELLRYLGFQVIRVSARVFEDGDYSDEFDHMALIVDIDDSTYLVDVGFGDFSFLPLDMRSREMQGNKNGDFKIEEHECNQFVVSKIVDNAPVPKYTFQTISRSLAEFKPRCRYHQSDPRSHFTQQKLISIDTEDGRITLTENKLKVRTSGSAKETPISGKDDFEQKLLEIFDINVTDLLKKNEDQIES